MYSGRVLVGFWFDKLQLELDKLESFKRKRDKGELLEQRVERLINTFTHSSPLPPPRKSNYLVYGQHIHLHCPEILDLSQRVDRSLICPGDIQKPLPPPPYGLVLAATAAYEDVYGKVDGIRDGCPLACVSRPKRPEARSVFMFRSVKGCEKDEMDGEVVVFGKELYVQLVHAKDTLYLRSETPLVDGQYGPNNHNPLRLSITRDCYAKWRILHWDRHRRLETEGAPIKPCARMIMQHVMTGKCLAAESLIWHQSLLGYECGVSVHTYNDVHRNETSECIWNAIVVKNAEEDPVKY